MVGEPQLIMATIFARTSSRPTTRAAQKQKEIFLETNRWIWQSKGTEVRSGSEVFSSEILLCSILIFTTCINQWGLLGESIDRVSQSGTLGVEAEAHKYSGRPRETTHLRAACSNTGPTQVLEARSEILYQIESSRRENLPRLSTGEDLAPASQYLWHGPLRPVYPTTGFLDIFVHIRLHRLPYPSSSQPPYSKISLFTYAHK